MNEDQAKKLLELFQKLIDKLDEHKVQISILDETFIKQSEYLREEISKLKK